MKYSLYADHVELTTWDHEQLDKKLERLRKHLILPYTIDVTISHDTHHEKGRVVTCKINVKMGTRVHHAERVSDTVQDAIDEALTALKRELAKHHDRNKRRRWNIRRWF